MGGGDRNEDEYLESVLEWPMNIKKYYFQRKLGYILPLLLFKSDLKPLFDFPSRPIATHDVSSILNPSKIKYISST